MPSPVFTYISNMICDHCWNPAIRVFDVISGHSFGESYPLCREAVGVFCIPSRLGYLIAHCSMRTDKVLVFLVEKKFVRVENNIKYIIDWLIDFNGMSTCQGIFQALRFVVWWLVPRDFRYLWGIKDIVFLKHGQYWKISISSKTNFGRNANSARLIIFVGLYHFS